MELRWSLACLLSSLVMSLAIPASLVEEIKASGLRDNKVKRAQLNPGEDDTKDIPYFSKPTAIKRGTLNFKNPTNEQQSLAEWQQEQGYYQNPSTLANIQSSLYNSDTPYDDKSISEYEKGFQYGTNKEKLDEALENAVLKSELYGDPAPLNQYRYYNDDRRRRRRRDAQSKKLDSRMKRDADLTPEEILTILSLYENERQNYHPYNYQTGDSLDSQDDDENWMDTPVYPHSSRNNELPSSDYLYEKRSRWGGIADRKKRFMVAKKRNDPTRELRYLNGPNKNDYYTLSQLLSGQREPDVPLYHRLVL